MRVALYGAFLSPTGYGRNGREFAKWLWKEGVDVVVLNSEIGRPPSSLGISKKDLELIFSLSQKEAKNVDIWMTVWGAENFKETSKIDIGYSMTECSGIPIEWVRKCNRMDEVWVPSSGSKEAFVESGVDETKVNIVPYGIDVEAFSPGLKGDFFQGSEIEKVGFKFLLDADWIPRKAIPQTLEVYLNTFRKEDDVVLILKTFKSMGQGGKQEIVTAIKKLKEVHPNSGKIYWIEKTLSDEEINRLYASIDCVVLCSMGEGVGLPPLQAMACEKPYIASKVRGLEDFISDETGYLVDKIEKVRLPSLGLFTDHIYEEFFFDQPNFGQLQQRFLEVYENQDKAKEKGARGREYVEKTLAWSIRAKEFVSRFESLLEKTKHRTKQEVKKVIFEVPSLGKQNKIEKYAQKVGKSISSSITLEGIVKTSLPNINNKQIPQILWEALDKTETIHVHFDYSYEEKYLKMLKAKHRDKNLFVTVHTLSKERNNHLIEEVFDKIVVPSEAMKSVALECGIQKTIKVIPYPSPLILDKNFKIRNKIKNIGIFGSYEFDLKNMYMTIKVLSETKGLNLFIFLSGENKVEYRNTEMFIKDLSCYRVKLIKDEKDLSKVAQELDLIVIPLSETEWLECSLFVRECFVWKVPLLCFESNSVHDLQEEIIKCAPTKEELLSSLEVLEKSKEKREKAVLNMIDKGQKENIAVITQRYIDFWKESWE